MNKIEFVKANEMNGDDQSLPSPPVARVSIRVRTMGNRSCRCGFYFYRNFLIGLNVLYLLISISLLMLVIAARAIMYLNSIPVLGGVAASAVILFLIAIIGLIAIIKQHQIILFFLVTDKLVNVPSKGRDIDPIPKTALVEQIIVQFMVTLGFTSALCFCLSVACMALPAHGQYEVLLDVWGSMATSGKSKIQNTLNCCGFNSDNHHYYQNDPPCYTMDGYKGPECCQGGNSTAAYALPLSKGDSSEYYTESCPSCHPCYPLWEHAIASALYTAGVIGFIFSFSQGMTRFVVIRKWQSMRYIMKDGNREILGDGYNSVPRIPNLTSECSLMVGCPALSSLSCKTITLGIFMVYRYRHLRNPAVNPYRNFL